MPATFSSTRPWVIRNATGGGWLTEPDDPVALAGTLREILVNPTALAERGAAGSRVVHERRNADSMARATLEVYRKYV